MNEKPSLLRKIPIMRLSLFFILLILQGFIANAQEIKNLRQLIQMADETSITLQVERLNLAIADAEVQNARVRPNFTFTNETVQIINKDMFHPGLPWNHHLHREEAWFLGKPLQIAGQRKHKIDLARESAKLEELNYKQTQEELYSEIAEQWKETVLAEQKENQIRLINQNLEELSTVNNDNISLKRLKIKNNIQLKIAETERAAIYNDLKDLLGSDDEFRINPNEIQIFLLDENNPARWEDQVIINRNDLKMIDYHQNISDINIKLQKANAIPQPEIGAIWNPKDGFPFFGLYISFDIPVFDRNQGEIRKARLESEQIALINNDIKSGLKNELYNSLRNYQSWKEIISENQGTLEYYNAALTDSKHLYLDGKLDFEEFKEVINEWKEAQEEHLDYLDKYLSSQIKLLLLTGTFNY